MPRLEALEDRTLLTNPGALDPTFGTSGRVITDFASSSTEEARSMAIDAQGRVVVVGHAASGSSLDFALARYLPDGSPDTSFGAGGRVIIDAGGNDQANAVAIDAQGRIVVAGTATSGTDRYMVVGRLLSNGDVDFSFGFFGGTIIDFGGFEDVANAVAIDTQGRIVVAGYAQSGTNRNFALARLLPNGAGDANFDADGIVTTDFGGIDEAFGVALQPDGRIVAAGYTSAGAFGTYDFALARYHPDGTPDSSFGVSGRSISDFYDATSDRAFGVALQSDGRIVAVGDVFGGGGLFLAVARFLPNGSFDPSFGESFRPGRVSTWVGGESSGRSVALQPDGRIVAAGSVYAGGGYNFALARYLPNGSLDTTFDLDGLVTTDFGTAGDEAKAVALQSDGRIVAAGFTLTAISGGARHIALARYLGDPEIQVLDGGTDIPDGAGSVNFGSTPGGTPVSRTFTVRNVGSSDLTLGPPITVPFGFTVTSSFGTTTLAPGAQTTFTVRLDGADVGTFSGQLTFASGDYDETRFNFTISGTVTAAGPYPGALDPMFAAGGRVITDLGSTTETANGVAIDAQGRIMVVGRAGSGAGSNIALARYLANGSLDTSFGVNGLVITDGLPGGYDAANAVALQPDGRIVVAGTAGSGAASNFMVARYLTNGSLDFSFGFFGGLFVDIAGGSDAANAVAIDAQGRIVLAGTATAGSNRDFALARLLSSGAPDSEFDGDGLVTTDFGISDEAYGLALQPDGRIVAAGYTSAGGGGYNFAATRYNLNGSLDTSFGISGRSIGDFTGFDDVAYAVALQPDGRIVIAGYTVVGGSDFAVARLLSNGYFDPSFGPAVTPGRVITNFPGGLDSAYGVVVQPDGRIVAAGFTTTGGGGENLALVRYLPSGSLDTSFDFDGRVLTDFLAQDNGASAVAFQADGRIVAAGYTGNTTSRNFALARYLGDPEIQLLDGTTDILDAGGPFNFGTTTVGMPLTRTFTVRNVGSTNLTLTPPITVPAGFTVTSGFGSTTLTPDTQTTFTVQLNATAAGTFSGQLSFANNDADENPFNFIISGIVENQINTLRVTNFTPTSTGFRVQLSRALDTTVLNLYDTQTSGLGPADVTLLGATSGPVHGSLVLNAARDGFTFIATGGPLPADSYTVTLRSAANGFRDTSGGLLDGNGDGTAGDDYTVTFPLTTFSRITVPDFMRGPGQPVNIPADGTGLPLRLSDGAGLTSVTLTLLYNPALLNITAATPGGSVPPGATVSLDMNTPGRAVLTLTSPTPLPPGPLDFIVLTASVPEDAPYGAKQVLSVELGGIAARDDDGLHVVGYFGDTTGNAGYSAADAIRVLRVAVGLDSGFSAWQLADPVLIADITGNDTMNATDATRILQEAVGLDRPEIPPPGSAPPFTPGGPDPFLNIPADFVAAPGAVLKVPVLLDLSDGLESADLAISYDTSRLEVLAVARGSLTEDFDLFAVNLDTAKGTMRAALARIGGPMLGRGSGSVLLITFRVREDAPAGPTVINLRQGIGLTTTQLNEGGLDLIPDPSDEEGDVLDGVISVLSENGKRSPAQSGGLGHFLEKVTSRLDLADAAFALLARRPRRGTNRSEA